MTTRVNNRMINGASVNVLDFGADPTGNLDSSSALQQAFNTATGRVTIPNGTYKVDSNIVVNLTSDINISGNNSRFVFASGITYPALSFTCNNNNIIFDDVEFEELDPSQGILLNITGAEKSEISRIKGTSLRYPVKVSNTESTDIYGCDLEGLYEASSLCFDTRGISNTKIYNNRTKYFSTAVSATHTNTDAKLYSIIGNTFLETFDTCIFWRSISTDATPNFVDEFVCSGNHLEDSGKGAVKVEIPNGNQTTMRLASITGNTFRGWGKEVGSAAIHINNAVSATGAIINRVISTGNSLHGRLLDDTYDVAGFSRAHFIQGVDNCILSDVCQDIASAGCLVTRSKNIKNTSVYTNCNLSSFKDSASIVYESSVSNVSDASIVDNCVDGSGVYLNKVQNYQLSGMYMNTDRYGIEEDSSGAAGEKIQGGVYVGCVLTGNTLGPILYALGEAPFSFEKGCSDDTGARDRGDTTKRNALGFNAFNSRGFTYLNTDTGNLDVYTGNNIWTSATLA